MTRSESAYLRAVKSALEKLGAEEKFDYASAIEMYDAWVKAPAAAAALAGARK